VKDLRDGSNITPSGDRPESLAEQSRSSVLKERMGAGVASKRDEALGQKEWVVSLEWVAGRWHT